MASGLPQEFMKNFAKEKLTLKELSPSEDQTQVHLNDRQTQCHGAKDTPKTLVLEEFTCFIRSQLILKIFLTLTG